MFDISELKDLLPEVRGRYQFNALLSMTTWFRVGGAAQVLFKPASLEDLQFFLKHRPRNFPLTIIGVGSNLLVRDGGIPGIVIRLGKHFNNIFVHDTEIDLGAGVLDRTAAMVAADHGITGLEFLCGIPGTIGGALRMNAGCYGTEIKDVIVHAYAIKPDGKLLKLLPDDLKFDYRHCGLPEDYIFVGARLKGVKGNSQEIHAKISTLLAERENTQPVKSRTGGSTFANPPGHSAWKLIDAAGCRGLTQGGAMVSEKHCNFLINTGTATAADLEELGEIVRKRVLETSGIELRWEIQRIGQPLDRQGAQKQNQVA